MADTVIMTFDYDFPVFKVGDRVRFINTHEVFSQFHNQTGVVTAFTTRGNGTVSVLFDSGRGVTADSSMFELITGESNDNL